MPVNKSKGHMYDWVSHVWNPLLGDCPHRCCYCLVKAMGKRFPAISERYSGPLRLEELFPKLGKGRIVFVGHMNDLWADKIPIEFIQRILAHTRKYPENTYVFQTKNPERYLYPGFGFPPKCILGTTIETNMDMYGIGKAPIPYYRMRAMEKVKARKFVTLEPIMEFDVKILAGWINRIRPEFVNIGADSKNHGLPEPNFKKIAQLINILKGFGIEIREKRNLERVKK